MESVLGIFAKKVLIHVEISVHRLYKYIILSNVAFAVSYSIKITFPIRWRFTHTVQNSLNLCVWLHSMQLTHTRQRQLYKGNIHRLWYLSYNNQSYSACLGLAVKGFSQPQF